MTEDDFGDPQWVPVRPGDPAPKDYTYEPVESVAGLLRELLEAVRGLCAEQAEASDLTYSVIARCIRGSRLYTGEE